MKVQEQVLDRIKTRELASIKEFAHRTADMVRVMENGYEKKSEVYSRMERFQNDVKRFFGVLWPDRALMNGSLQFEEAIRQKTELPWAQLMTFDRDLAQSILEDRNSKNRRQKPKQQERIAVALKRERFGLTGATIVFSSEGQLLDGQNRLAAVVRTGIPMTTFVAFGVNPKAFALIDQVQRRKNEDAHYIAGHEDAQVLSRAVEMVHRYHLTGKVSASAMPILPDESLELPAKYPGIEDAVKFVKRLGSAPATSAAVAAACYYLFAKKNGEKAKVFMEHLILGILLEQGNPIWVLRCRLEREKIEKIKKGKGVTMEEVVWLYFTAWNHWVMKQDIKKLTFPRTAVKKAGSVRKYAANNLPKLQG